MKENDFFKAFKKPASHLSPSPAEIGGKRLRAVFLTALIALPVFLSPPLRAYGAVEDISAAAAIAYEPVTGTVLYEKNADARMLVASTTKIMTALVVLEHCALEEPVTVTMQDAAVEGSSMYLRPGEHYTVEDLLYGLLLASGNDAAAALAEHTAGSIEGFAALMNDKCAQLGLQNTHFVNPHGLDDEEHYSSARDLALITAAAMENEAFRTIFSTEAHMVNGVCYTNHNKLLDMDERCTGGKTGYTEHAGRILVSTAESEGMSVICVTISAPDDWNDHQKLYDECFSAWRFIPALEEENAIVSVVSGTRDDAALAVECPGFLVPAGSEIETKIFLPRFVFAPVQTGEQAGTTQITIDGQRREIPILYAESVFVDGSIPLRPWEKFRRTWHIADRYGVYYPVG